MQVVIEAVLTGRVAPLGTATSAIAKAPVGGSVAVGPFGLAGDEQADRRAWQVRLTEAGAASIDEMADAHRGWIEAMFANLDDAQIAAAIATLTALRKPA